MKIIRPVSITDDVLVSSNIAEPYTGEVAWNPSTSYSVGQKVFRDGNHNIYERLVAGATPTAPESDATNWLLVGKTNRWQVFDKKVGSQSVRADSINFVLTPGRVDSICLLNISASTVLVEMTDPSEGLVYSHSVELISTAGIVDAYTYCFEEIVLKTDFVLTDLPPYVLASISITLSTPGAEVLCGEVVVGLQKILGLTQYSPSMGITDYSRKAVDIFGNYSVLERGFSKRMACDVLVETAVMDEVHKQLSVYRATPVVWVGSELYTSMLIYGFYKSFNMVLPGCQHAKCALEIEGLT